MASHELAIAKATFSAGLLRPDPTSISRDAIADFHSLLSAAIIQCSPKNVQKCKHWILDNITQSTARCTALGKYLTALTNNLAKPLDSSKREPSLKRKRLHLLYLLNDILYHCKHRAPDASVCGKLQPILVVLFGSAASFKGCPKHIRKLLDLLDIWEDQDYYSGDYISKLRQTVELASKEGDFNNGKTVIGEDEESKENGNATKSAPYIMPAMHGDASTPWFDLPAANLMPHIIPNSTKAINPELVQPLQLVAGSADANVILAVKTLLDDVDAIYGAAVHEGKATHDIDELGQPIIYDEITGEILEGEGYYGWSRSFCERMKQRRQGGGQRRRSSTRSSRSRSRSRSSTPGARKRRYSESSEDRASDRPRRRRRSYSPARSRSPSPNGYERSDAMEEDLSYSDTRRSEVLPPSYPASAPAMSMQSGYPFPFQHSQAPGPNIMPPFVPPPQSMPCNGWQGSPQNVQFNPANMQYGPWSIPPPPPPPPMPFQNQPPSTYPNGGWQPPGNGGGYSQYGNNPGYQGRGGRGGYGGGWS